MKAPVGNPFKQLKAAQVATADALDGSLVCFGCDGRIGANGSHRCRWCARTMHRFCGIADDSAEEGHGQAVDCKTSDCVDLRASADAPMKPTFEY